MAYAAELSTLSRRPKRLPLLLKGNQLESFMQKTAMLGISALALVLSVTGGRAYNESPWCARFGGGSDYYEDCSMSSFAMCLNEIRGTGGNAVCSPNPRARTLGSSR